MPILVNKLSEKCISTLGEKKISDTVKCGAVNAIKDGISEASAIAKKDIESAIGALNEKIASKDEFITQKDKATASRQETISEKLISWINIQRKNQVLDKNRMDTASDLIKSILEDAPDKSPEDIQGHFKKIMNRYLNSVNIFDVANKNDRVIRIDSGILDNNYSVEIFDANYFSYIKFIDRNEKDLLNIRFSDHYSFLISDKNGKEMVYSSIKNGVTDCLDVRFNDVKQTSEIINGVDKSKYNKDDFESFETFYYRTPKDKQRVIQSYSYFNDIKQPPQKSIYICKYDKDDFRNFDVIFLRTPKNEHWAVQSLYDRNYKDDGCILPTPVYEKHNYGTMSYPLTHSFTYRNLSLKQNIKPWDFSILKPYIK